MQLENPGKMIDPKLSCDDHDWDVAHINERQRFANRCWHIIPIKVTDLERTYVRLLNSAFLHSRHS